jgi:hypothetical protein
MKGHFMKKIIPKRLRSLREWGQTLALVVIALPAFIGAMGLATDVGNFYYNYYKLQTAADTAVLAGAMCLPTQNNCTATTTANTYATANGVKGSDTITGPTVGGGNTTLTIGISRNVPYYFARLVGVNSGTVNVSATAQGGPVGSVNSNNLLPLGLQVCLASVPADACSATPYTVGQTLTFAAKSDDGSGNWGALVLPLNSLSVCPTGGGCVSSDPGFAKIKHVIDDANARISQGLSVDPGGTASSHISTPADQRAVTVPLVDWGPGGVNGSKPMNVYGFAEMWLTSASNGGPGGSTITATFISQTTNGTVDTGGTASDVGATAVKLIQ